MRLHDDRSAFEEIISAVSLAKGLEKSQVEKDYYVSLFLSLLSLSTDPVIVFKGGTSLSKCHDVIHRFSEDIDLAILFPKEKAGDGWRKRLKEKIVSAVSDLNMKIINSESIQSDRDFNRYEIAFGMIPEDLGSIRPVILAETIVVYRPYPVENRLVSNLITQYLEKTGRDDLIKKYDLFPFPMLVQSLERTFVDKLFALCDYHLSRRFSRNSRHIYDLHQIWISGRLNLEVVRHIIPEVMRDRQLLGRNNLSCQAGQRPNDLLAEILRSGEFQDDYDKVTKQLLFEAVSYSEAVATLEGIHDQCFLPVEVQPYC